SPGHDEHPNGMLARSSAKAAAVGATNARSLRERGRPGGIERGCDTSGAAKQLSVGENRPHLTETGLAQAVEDVVARIGRAVLFGKAFGVEKRRKPQDLLALAVGLAGFAELGVGDGDNGMGLELQI